MSEKWNKTAAYAIGLVLATAGLPGCNKTVGSKLGSTLGQVGDSYLSQAGLSSNGALSDMTTEVGGILGENIQKYLDASERKQAEAAARSAIESGAVGNNSTRTWKSQTNSGVSGGSTVLAKSVDASGRECRTQRNFVNVKGKDVEQTETLCRDPKTGTWSPQNA